MTDLDWSPGVIDHPFSHKIGEAIEEAVRYLAAKAAEENDSITVPPDLYAEVMLTIAYGRYTELLETCESPIERLFCAGIAANLAQNEFRVRSQAPIGPYRVDFLMWDERRDLPQVVVELDGHDFHERTKQQAERDRKRDRYFTARGYRVCRITGSELWRDPMDAVMQAMDVLYGVDD